MEQPAQVRYEVAVRNFLVSHFSDSELRDLYFDLAIDYDSLPGQGTKDKARELVRYVQRHGRISELVKQCRRLRPNADWRDIDHVKISEQLHTPQSETKTTTGKDRSKSLFNTLISNRTVIMFGFAGLLTIVAASISLNIAPDKFFLLMIISGSLWALATVISLYQQKEDIKEIELPLWRKSLIIGIALIAAFLGPWYLMVAILSLLRPAS